MGSLHRISEHIEDLQSRLDEMRTEYADEPDLYAMYSQSLLHNLRILRQKARQELSAPDDADVWISLNGPQFGNGSGPMSVVSTFFSKFRVASKHCASALQGETQQPGRFTNEVESAVSFNMTQFAPGSLRIGLSKNTRSSVRSSLLTVYDLEQVSDEAITEQNLGMRAIRTLVLSLRAAQDDGALARLRDELSDHGTLRVLYHARFLFPAGVQEVEFSGRWIEEQQSFPASITDELRRIADDLVQEERTVSGVGVLRMIDAKSESLRFDRVRVEGFPGIETIKGDYAGVTAENIAYYLNKMVSFSGLLHFSDRGVPQKVFVDTLREVDRNDKG